MTLDDDEIAERIASRLLSLYSHDEMSDAVWLAADATNRLDDAEAYQLAHVECVRERRDVRRRQKRVRAKVLALLGLADRKEVAR